MPRTHLYSTAGAQEAGLQPLNLLIQQPPDWLWPNRIPLGKLTLIAGYPSSGKTSIALDIAARVSRGAPAPDQPDTLFPFAPVVLALFDGNPKSDVLPTLRLFGADLERIYLADLLSPTHSIDYYPDDPPNDDDEEVNHDWGAKDWDDDEEEDEEYGFDNDGNEIRVPRRRPVGVRVPPPLPWKPPNAAADFTAPWPSLNKVMKRLANLIEAGSAALLIVDQVEDLASMHRAHVTTVLGMLKALAARSGAAVVALTHNPAPTYPRAVAAMQRRLAQASVVFTTALVEPGERRFLIPLRPAMSDDAPAIPFVLPPSPVTPGKTAPLMVSLSNHPAKAGNQSPLSHGLTLAWRKPVLPAHINALADPNRDHGARTRAARSLLVRALADGPRPRRSGRARSRHARHIQVHPRPRPRALQRQGLPHQHARSPERPWRVVLVAPGHPCPTGCRARGTFERMRLLLLQAQEAGRGHENACQNRNKNVRTDTTATRKTGEQGSHRSAG